MYYCVLSKLQTEQSISLKLVCIMTCSVIMISCNASHADCVRFVYVIYKLSNHTIDVFETLFICVSHKGVHCLLSFIISGETCHVSSDVFTFSGYCNASHAIITHIKIKPCNQITIVVDIT